jgi:alkanesulfonate monooxygenase SsuD/methylene tetrahydromethanopterin reductase-like flavin-dependent oxidoreductase (luciferase family)
MGQIQFGLQIPAETRNKASRATYVADVNRALDMAAGHFDSAWVVDHLQEGDMDVLESFTTLSYFAALHSPLKFGHNVICQSFRNPALVAKMGATLQMLTGGRFLLGLGAGWHEEEYRAYGYDFPTDGVRVAQLEEAVQIIKGLWTQEQTTFTGRYYQVNQAYCEPKPDPIPPIMIGAFRPKMLRLTARYADEWNVSSTGPNEYRRLVQEFDRACAEVGHDPATVRRSWCGGCAVAPTQAEAAHLTDGRWRADDEDDFGFVGTPAQVVEQMRPFIDLGLIHFILDCGGFPDLTTLELLISEVLPALNS